MRWDLLGAVLRKEVVDNVRDRRAVSMALFFPLLGPLMMALVLVLVSRQVRTAEERPLPLPVAGREHAPHLVEYLESAGAEVVPAPADPEAAVRSGDADVVLVIPPEFGERLREGRPAPVRLVLDDSRQSSRTAIERARRLLQGWSHRTGALRLMARGVHPAAAEALAVETVDLATPESRAAFLFAMLPYFLMMTLFLGGMYVAIDTTAGERERSSLEPLLLHPVPRSAVALAKVAATALFSAMALAETVVGFGLLPLAMPVERLGFSIRLGPGVLLRIYLLLLPLVLLVSAVMVVVSARARGYKAAQTSLSFLMLVPMIPGVFLALVPVKLARWMMLVPSLGEQLLVNRLVRGEPLPASLFLASAGSTLCWAGLLLGLTVALFRSEKLMFGR